MMTEYAIVDNGAIVEFRQFTETPEPLSGKPYRVFLPTEYVTPEFDPLAEALTGRYSDNLLPDKVVRTAVLADLPPPPTPPTPTPSNSPLSMRQLRLGLVLNGFPVDFIRTAVNAIPDTMQRAVATIWLEETTIVHWDHPMTQQLIAAAGLDAAQAATMWMAAKDLEA
jgi:hypothetical protein